MVLSPFFLFLCKLEFNIIAVSSSQRLPFFRFAHWNNACQVVSQKVGSQSCGAMLLSQTIDPSLCLCIHGWSIMCDCCLACFDTDFNRKPPCFRRQILCGSRLSLWSLSRSPCHVPLAPLPSTPELYSLWGLMRI